MGVETVIEGGGALDLRGNWEMMERLATADRRMAKSIRAEFFLVADF